MQQIVIASHTLSDRQPGDCVVVRTPLDLISAIEQRPGVATVILADTFATQPGVREFLHEEYPWLRVVSLEAPRHAHRASHAVGEAALAE
jgi:hypothetical protein